MELGLCAEHATRTRALVPLSKHSRGYSAVTLAAQSPPPLAGGSGVSTRTLSPTKRGIAFAPSVFSPLGPRRSEKSLLFYPARARRATRAPGNSRDVTGG